MAFPPARWSDKLMRAAKAEGIRSPIEIAKVPVPLIEEDDVLLRVVASGICRSDWHIWNGDGAWSGVNLPPTGILGHEVAGVVMEVGTRVRNVKAGQRVTVPFHLSCGHCASCMQGFQNRCDDGDSVNLLPGSGGWAQYMRVPSADLNCIGLPDEIDDLTAAALGCRYMTAWRGLSRRGAVSGGETVAVFGCGAVGLAAVEIARCLGAEVLAVDVDDSKLQLARDIGARGTINARGLSPEQTARAVKGLTGGDRGADLAVDALGLSHTVNSALHSLRKGGRLTQIGLTSQDEKGHVSIPLDMLVVKELEMVGSLGNPHWAYGELLKLVAGGRLKPQRLVSRQVRLSDVGSVLHDMDTFKTSGYVVITDFEN